jgi:hypothetical protein
MTPGRGARAALSERARADDLLLPAREPPGSMGYD